METMKASFPIEIHTNCTRYHGKTITESWTAYATLFGQTIAQTGSRSKETLAINACKRLVRDLSKTQ